jgi:hypothetical protein
LFQYSGTATPVFGTVYVKGTAGQTINFNGSIKTFNGNWQRIDNLLIVDGSNTYMSFRGIVGSTTALDFEVWGTQGEAGSYATSYIPTTSASVTRNADVISKTGISSLIDSQQGVLFLDSSALENNTSARFIELNDNTGGISNNIYFRYEPFSNVIAYTVFSGGALQCNISYSLSSQTDYNKMAFVWALNRFEIWVNGAKVQDDTSGVAPVSSSISKLMFSQRNGTENYEGNLKTLAIWKTALTNTQLAQLTTI